MNRKEAVAWLDRQVRRPWGSVADLGAAFGRAGRRAVAWLGLQLGRVRETTVVLLAAMFAERRRAVGWLGRQLHRPWATIGAFLAALFLAGVPTYFALYPDQASHSPRGALFGAWVLSAVLVGVGAALRDEGINKFLREREIEEQRAKVHVRNAILDELIRPGVRGTPASFTWQIHLIDPTDHLLKPYHPENPNPAAQFRIGQGAVGQAFLRDDVVAVVGSTATSQTLNLNEAQITAFGHWQSVVAAPLRARGVALGVLSAASEEPDRSFDVPAGQALLRELAEMVATVLARV